MEFHTKWGRAYLRRKYSQANLNYLKATVGDYLLRVYEYSVITGMWVESKTNGQMESTRSLSILPIELFTLS